MRSTLQIKASDSVLHVTELAGVQMPAGALGTLSATGPVPSTPFIIDQGGLIVREVRSEVYSAEVRVDKLQSEVEVAVQVIYDRVDELRQMVDVAGQVAKVRTEAARLADRQFGETAALSSAGSQSHADLTSATASRLEADCFLSLAEADLNSMIGQMPHRGNFMRKRFLHERRY